MFCLNPFLSLEKINYVKNSREIFPLNAAFESIKKKVISFRSFLIAKKPKLCIQLREILNLNINESFANECTCVRDLIFLISTCKKPLKINKLYKDITLWQMLSKHKISKYQFLEKLFKKIMNYIYNIPSDYFRILHPKNLIACSI